MKTKLKNQKGFTIIEVLIVLAIAGLIMLIVFLAVPALQRNSRNTAAKNDVANVLGGISEYQGANNGAMPTTISGTGTVNYGAGNATTASVQGSTVVALGSAAPATVGPINVELGKNCAGTTNTRIAAARYRIETTAGTVALCQDT